MKISPILMCISRLLYPFMLLFGFYVIINGHTSPGGGFQGGAILATAILITFFINPKRITNLNFLIKLEKLSFIGILIVSSISFFTKRIFFTNFVHSIDLKVIFLVTLNLFIGIKVALGLVSMFSTFIDEGRS